MDRAYYEAYDDRYRQAHALKLEWFSREPSKIVCGVIDRYNIESGSRMLEIGCGEGRDAIPLLRAGYRLEATDISAEAVAFCRKTAPEFADRFYVLDCVGGSHAEIYDFIFAVAVIHMLVDDMSRAAFWRFIMEHLNPKGIALVCSMGDGEMSRASDPDNAFTLSERRHDASGKTLRVAATSCRMVTKERFLDEAVSAGLIVKEYGLTEIEPDFSGMPVMYAVLGRN